MAEFNLKRQPPILSKQRSWSPDIHRDIEWQKLKKNQRLRRSKSIGDAAGADVTDDDVKELRACFELGFGFDLSTDLDPKLIKAFPALEFYAAVKRGVNGGGVVLSRCSSLSSDSSSSSTNSTSAFIDPGDDPKKVKMKLKQWAQLVSCSVLEASSQLANNNNNKHAAEKESIIS